MTVVLLIPGDPVATPRHRSAVRGGRACSYMPTEYTDWKEATAAGFAGQLLADRPGFALLVAAMELGVRVRIDVVFARPKSRPKGVDPAQWKAGGRVRRLAKPDADNLWKAAVDALCLAMVERFGLVAWDDCCCEIGASDRWYAAVGEAPHVRLVVEQLE